MDTARLEVDLHLLELRFAGARLIEPQAVEKLARSIERDGQIVPCIVAATFPETSGAAGSEHLVLIDGYRLVAAPLPDTGRAGIQDGRSPSDDAVTCYPVSSPRHCSGSRSQTSLHAPAAAGSLRHIAVAQQVPRKVWKRACQ